MRWGETWKGKRYLTLNLCIKFAMNLTAEQMDSYAIIRRVFADK